MIEYRTDLYLIAFDGDKTDLHIAIFDKAKDIEAHRAKLPKLAAIRLKLYGAQLIFVTNEVKPGAKQSGFEQFLQIFGKGKKGGGTSA